MVIYCLGYEKLKIIKIKALAFQCEYNKPAEIEPDKETEKWFYGVFSPHEIWLDINILPISKKEITIKVYCNVKIGKRVFSEEKGINIPYLENSAKWRGEQLLKNFQLKIKDDSKQFKYIYKCSLDSLFAEVYEKGYWPYIIAFRVEVEQDSKKTFAQKNIMIIPDNRKDY
jgi:hypothetical protein